MTNLYANNAAGTLAAAITTGSTTLTLNAGQAALFPNPGANQGFFATLTDAATQSQIEIVYVTQVSGSIFTIQRAQDGTAAQSWNAGDILSQRVVAAELRDFVSQANGGNVTGTLTVPTATAGGQATPFSQTLNRLAAFTSSGNFTVPQGVTTIIVSACAGGGGGGGGGGTVGTTSGVGGGGGGGAGCGQSALKQVYAVTPGQTIPITVGGGGNGGAAGGSGGGNGQQGTAGGNTVVGTLLTLTGGSGGIGALGVTNAAAPAGTGGGAGGSGGQGYPTGGAGLDGNYAGNGGTGSSTPFGGGGGSGRAATTGGVNGSNVLGTGYGAGGGGGGGAYGSAANAGGPGGSGGGGVVYIEW